MFDQIEDVGEHNNISNSTLEEYENKLVDQLRQGPSLFWFICVRRC